MYLTRVNALSCVFGRFIKIELSLLCQSITQTYHLSTQTAYIPLVTECARIDYQFIHLSEFDVVFWSSVTWAGWISDQCKGFHVTMFTLK